MSDIKYQFRCVDYSDETGEVIRGTEWRDWPIGDDLYVDTWEGVQFREAKPNPSKPQRQYRWKANNDHGTWTEWLDVPKSGCTSFVAEGVASVEFRDKPEPPKWEVGKWYELPHAGHNPFTVKAVDDAGWAIIAYFHSNGRYLYAPSRRIEHREIKAPE
jgi:hypothetical protein